MPESAYDRQYIGPQTICGGVRQDVDAVDLKPNESPYSQNWVLRTGKLVVREALRTFDDFAGITGVTPLTQPFNGAYYFESGTGTRYFFTANYVSPLGYIWQYTGGNWTKISVDLDTDLGGNNYPWSIAGGIDTVVGTNGAVFFCNGVNEVLAYDLTTMKELFDTTSYSGPTNPVAKYCCIFEGRLVLANMTESSTVYVFRMRASAVNKFNDFNTVDGAQLVDHADTPGAITGLAVMGNRLIILKEDAIIFGQSTQDILTPLVYPLRLNTGCLTGRSFQSITPSVAIFLGPDNVYLLTQGDIKPIGDAIRADLFATLDYNQIYNICSHVQHNKGLYRLFIPNATTTGTYAYVFNFVDGFWFREYWPGGVYAAENVIGTGSGTLISALGAALSTYSNQISAWGSTISQEVTVFSSSQSSTSYRIMDLNEGLYNDEASGAYVAIAPEWQSKLLKLNPEGYTTLVSVHVAYKSTSAVAMTVGVSGDKGVSWTDVTNQLPASGAATVGAGHAHFNFRSTAVYHQIRIKVSPSSLISFPSQAAESTPIEIQSLELIHLKRAAER